MAKRFLGSVGKAEAFRYENGKLVPLFVSKTLTDSGLNISTTKDDIRAGEGAPIQFSFYHDPSVEITLTDVLWKKEYLEAQLGAKFTQDANSQAYHTVKKAFTYADNVLNANLDEAIAPLPYNCAESKQVYFAWAAKEGSDDWFALTIGSDYKAVSFAGVAADAGNYCVRYLAADANAHVAEINSTIIPEELVLLITAPIFAGDACNASKGKPVGHITFEVPRFQLNGSQEFAMNMSSNQTMSLAGIALASESLDCDANGGKLLRVIEVIDNENWYDEVEELIADEDYLKVGQEPHIYGLKKDGSVIKCDNANLTFDPVLASGKWSAAGSQNIKITGKTSVSEDVTIVNA